MQKSSSELFNEWLDSIPKVFKYLIILVTMIVFLVMISATGYIPGSN